MRDDDDDAQGEPEPTLLDPAAEPPPMLRRDDTLAHGVHVGRYMVLKLIGRGGMGAVYAAHDTQLDRQVALKLLHSTRGDAPERLVREAQALARLSDPHVVTVYDAGEIDGQVFIAMQLVVGEDLSKALKRKPTIAQILDWFGQAGRGLAAAHAAGLVHRDFKPSNVLIDHQGRVAVTDFGLVRSAAVAQGHGLTRMGDLMGTPAFMSPEQHNLQPATEASDQFAFCVSLWDALFGQHPLVEGDRGSMSPFEIGYKIFDGTLIPPPRGTRVPRRVIDALTRGLSRDPEARWPTMDALIAELGPPPVRRPTWPYVAAGLAAAAIGGAVVWFLVGRDERPVSCRVEAERRVETAWSPAAGARLRERFVATGRTYAEAAARQAAAEIDRYAARWGQLATDVCSAERAARGAPAELVVRRRSCLDLRLDALRGLAELLTTLDRPEFVDHASTMAAGLPDLGDCTDPDALPSEPPAAIAAEVASLGTQVGLATARGHGGDPRAIDELAALAERADALAWPPLQVRALLALGERRNGAFVIGGDDLVRAGELATRHRLDREAARAWAGATITAGLARKQDAVAVLAPLARAAAARTGDRELQVETEIAYGRAQNRLGDYQGASATCKAALATAQTLERATAIAGARDCLVESLAPLAAFSELEPLLAQAIADETRALGEDHPRIADYLSIRIRMSLGQLKIATARADADRVLAIRRRAFPPRHFKMAEALHGVALVKAATGKWEEARPLAEEGLAIAAETKPQPLQLVGALHTLLAFADQDAGDRAGALAHFEEATRAIRKRTGDHSLELGVVLGNYGQIKALSDPDAGLAILAEAYAILSSRHDKRAPLIFVAMAEIEVANRRWASARTHAEQMLATSATDADLDPANLALARWLLARALVETSGDRARARQLATEAREAYAKLGTTAEVAKIDAWLAKL